MIDNQLADLYDVPTFRLNEAVKRNRRRFPADFMFQLNRKETTSLTSQNAMSNSPRGGRRTLPYAFTEQGVAMLSSVLNSDRAIEVNIAIMRAFVRLREILATHKDLAERVARLEEETDQRFQVVFEAIERIEEPPPLPQKRRIGFPAPSRSKR